MMKKLFSILSIAACTTLAINAQEIYELWPDGARDNNGHDNTSSITVYHPESANSGQAVLICPGGGYQYLAMDHEGHEMARLLAGNGITAAVLKYRFPHGHHNIPADDARQAIRIIRDNAATWDVNPDKVGVAGFSAGGHLASTVSVTWPDSTLRPDFSILVYPVISVRPDITHKGSAHNLLGDNINDETYLKAYSNDEQVNATTPPTLLLLSSDDTTVPVDNSIRYYKALVNNNIPAEMHIYPIGNHGWGMHDTFPFQQEVRDIIIRYVKAI